jgi:hypothetical protein
MLEAGLEFDGEPDRVFAALIALPRPLRPVHFSHEEKIVDTADRVEDQKRFAAFRAKSQSGFFLLGERVTYSVRLATGKPLICDCFIDVQPDIAKQFLVQMSTARPLFGFACAPAEREYRNRVTVQQGGNKIENWVGRDTRKNVPGLYWLTLLSETLAKQHSVSFAAIEAVAKEHIALEGSEHLFRFYDRPEDWQKTNAVTELCVSLPGVFNVEEIKPQLQAAKSFLELNSMLRDWR